MPYSLLNTVIILIHGTWGTSSDWHQPGGLFHDMLQMQAEKKGATVVPFCWSGANDPKARSTAAQALVQLIKSYPSDMPLYVIGHSHGGNVATLASRLLPKHAPKHRIHSLYLLGTPARAVDYGPNMDVITYLYNLVSFQDFIQPVIGIFDRAQPTHPRIANMSISINDKEPGHSDMHHYSIGLWLLYLDQQMYEKESEGFVNFTFEKAGVLQFFNHEEPRYTIDPEWETKIKEDKRLQERLVDTILRNTLKTTHSLAMDLYPESRPLLGCDQVIR